MSPTFLLSLDALFYLFDFPLDLLAFDGVPFFRQSVPCPAESSPQLVEFTLVIFT